MTNVIDQFRNQFVRRAIVMEIGGFRPSESMTTSWFGRVNLKASGENWPTQDGKPMLPLTQINVTELPFRPSGLEDIDFITVFISSQRLSLPTDKNGSSWVLRTYNAIEGLIVIEKPEMSSPIKPFQMRPRIIEHDYPCFDDVPLPFRKQVWDAYQENKFENADGFKLGGWPTLIQSEIEWALIQEQHLKPEYVFQIDTTQKGNWAWGDNGVGYFGRVAINGLNDEWILEWQSF